MKDLLMQLKTIGRIKENIVLPDNIEGNISVVIEIINN
jgi:hypothetical protein